MTLLISVAAAVGGTVSFSLLFGVPTKYYSYCGLIGGAGWAVYYIVTNELDKASQTGYMALKVAVAIVLGIVFVFELPQGIFGVFSKKEEKQGNPRSR